VGAKRRDIRAGWWIGLAKQDAAQHKRATVRLGTKKRHNTGDGMMGRPKSLSFLFSHPAQLSLHVPSYPAWHKPNMPQPIRLPYTTKVWEDMDPWNGHSDFWLNEGGRRSRAIMTAVS